MTTVTELRYDPWDRELFRDPYPTYRRLREEAPLYYDAEHDFYAVSRYPDCRRWIGEWETFSSAKGGMIDLIKADLPIPAGTLIFDDPPVHDLHRGLLARAFTPRRVKELEPQIREYCRTILDPLRDESRFDLVQQFGALMPMKVIGMLLGIPESDQDAVRHHVDENLKSGEDGHVDYAAREHVLGGTELFEDYIDWRAKNPSDDIMTELLTARFTDEKGVERTLTREEVLTYVTVLAGAGNETTTKLIGWMGVLLAKHPEQRRQVVEDRSLVMRTVMEVLRYEPPGPSIARYLTRDLEMHGQTIPAGSPVLFIIASANRDDRRYPDGDTFDITRKDPDLLSFGYGPHFCLGQNLAKLEGRIALEELVARFPEWEVDWSGAEFQQTPTVRGYETLPITLP